MALEVGFRRAGYDVRIACGEPFEELARSSGLEFCPVYGDVRALVGELLAADPGTVPFARKLARELEPTMRRSLWDYQIACKNADLVVWGPMGVLGSRIARRAGIPNVGAYLQPMFYPNPLYRSSFMPAAPGIVGRWPHLRGWYNQLTYFVAEQTFWQAFRKPLNRIIVEELGSKPIRFVGPFRDPEERATVILNGWSPAVLPEAPDGNVHVETTGFWQLPTPNTWSPPAELENFLKRGPPPISIGFGSLHDREAGELTNIVLEALRRARRRGVLLTGWGGLSKRDLPDSVFCLDEAPHDWLFQRVEAAVHHGGAGTTATALRAGVPSIVVPFMADQRFWGDVVSDLGVGVQQKSRRTLNATDLGVAIEKATTKPMKRTASVTARKIREEDGVSCAVEAVEARRLVSN